MISITIVTKDIDRAKASLQARVEALDFTTVMRGITRDLEKLHELYFDRQGGPEGAWKPLAPATVAKKGHATILEETERLRNSLASRTSDSIRELTRNGNRTTLRFGTTREHAPKHQRGTARIPKRMHTGFTRAESRVMAQRVAISTVRQLTAKLVKAEL